MTTRTMTSKANNQPIGSETRAILLLCKVKTHIESTAKSNKPPANRLLPLFLFHFIVGKAFSTSFGMKIFGELWIFVVDAFRNPWILRRPFSL
jgi:hypothetical protein